MPASRRRRPRRWQVIYPTEPPKKVTRGGSEVIRIAQWFLLFVLRCCIQERKPSVISLSSDDFAHEPNTVLLDNALTTMGAGLPAAIAAKLVHPDRKVIAICGDGGFMMNSAELETAVRLGLDLVVIILRDGALGMIKWKQDDDGFADYGLDFGNPDFVRYAESYGARGVRVEAAGGLRSALEEAFERGGVTVVDVPIDYSVNEQLEANSLRDEVQRVL